MKCPKVVTLFPFFLLVLCHYSLFLFLFFISFPALFLGSFLTYFLFVTISGLFEWRVIVHYGDTYFQAFLNVMKHKFFLTLAWPPLEYLLLQQVFSVKGSR